MIGQTISHYRILSKLGQGGMGGVYLAGATVRDAIEDRPEGIDLPSVFRWATQMAAELKGVLSGMQRAKN